MKLHKRILTTIIALLTLVLTCHTLSATEAWTPATGDVNLDERPENKPEAQFKHAAALLSAGEPRSAAKQLEALIEEHPKAKWNPHARFLLGLARFNSGYYESAFAAWDQLQTEYPENDRRKQVFQLQRKAANKIARHDLEEALSLYDKLVDIAPNANMGAQVQKAKADALFERGRYMYASDQYLALVDYYPGSTRVPYAWYRIGVCHLEMARWIGRGTDQLVQAIRRFEDFLANFPDHRLAAKARKKLKEAQNLRAEKYARIAEYYMGPAQRPSAALPYLEYMRDALPETKTGEWAEQEISEVVKTDQPPRGRVTPMSLPGVVTTSNEKEGEDQ